MRVEPITFKAYIPTIQSAIKLAGDGGMRLTLDIPETEMADALPIIQMRECILLVTIDIETDDEVLE